MAHGSDYEGPKSVDAFQSKIKDIIKDFDSIVIRLQEKTKKWELEEKPYPKYKDAKTQILANDQNMLTKAVQILVFGCTNAGKSALINAILRKKILPSHHGPTTICFTEVHKSADNSSYIIFPDDSREMDLSKISLVDKTKNNGKIKIPIGSNVKIYISKEEYPKLTENIIIIDSPGIYGYEDLDAHITERCRISDILILVINSGGTFNQVRKDFVRSFQTQFTQVKIIVVINQWDLIADDDKDYYKENYKIEANECLSETTGVNKSYDVFFLSATEQLNIIQHESNNLAINSNEERRQSFNDFLKCLQDNIKEQSLCQSKLETNVNILKSTFDELQQCRRDMEVKLHDQIKDKLSSFNKLLDLNEMLKEHSNYIFKDFYEMYFVIGLKSFKTSSVHESTSNMEIYLKEFMIVIIESLKVFIGDSIRKENKPGSSFIIQTLETFYYPFLYDLVKKIKTIHIKEFNKTFADIADCIKRWKRNAKIFGVIAGVPLAGVGIVAGILLPIETAIAAPILGVAAGTFGGGMSGITAKCITKVREFKRNHSKKKYEDKEKGIETWWKNKKKKFENSYEEFLSSLHDLVKTELSKLYEVETTINEKVEYLRKECGLSIELIEL